MGIEGGGSGGRIFRNSTRKAIMQSKDKVMIQQCVSGRGSAYKLANM